MKKLLALAVALVLVMSLATVASAAEYPTKGISVICPWGAGGGTDACLRAFCEALNKQLGVTLTVDNLTGASGVTGHEAIADADPDGYTMGMITFELAGYKAQEMSDYTYENYDAICRVNTDAAAITVNTDWAAANGITDVATFVEYCKAHPGEVMMGGSAAASVWHIAGGYLMNATGIEIKMITYADGAAGAVKAAAQGEIQGVTVSLAEARAFIGNGLTVLGVMDSQRTRPSRMPPPARSRALTSSTPPSAASPSRRASMLRSVRRWKLPAPPRSRTRTSSSSWRTTARRSPT